jgi:hypothetical protein
MAKKQITLNIDQNSAEALGKSKTSLISWKSVGNSDASTVPLVWLVNDFLGMTTVIDYSEALSVYVGQDSSASTAVVYSTPIALGQSLVLSANGGSWQVMNDGPAGDVGVQNYTGVPYSCGVSQSAPGSTVPAPYCKTALFGTASEFFRPIDKILLGFTSASLTPGEYVPSLASAGSPVATQRVQGTATLINQMLLVDMTSVDTRTVRFDVNSGWAGFEPSWGTQYAASTPLNTILVEGD